MAEIRHIRAERVNSIYARDHKINFMGVCWCEPIRKIAKNGDLVFTHKI
jgi:hypothetical protein